MPKGIGQLSNGAGAVAWVFSQRGHHSQVHPFRNRLRSARSSATGRHRFVAEDLVDRGDLTSQVRATAFARDHVATIHSA